MLSSSNRTPAYPLRANRYLSLGWNSHYQYCYTDDDIFLLQQITAEYLKIACPDKKVLFFETQTQQKLYNLWECTKPTFLDESRQAELSSYTLPTREAKDTRLYPLWQFADSVAKDIANWQSDRTKHQLKHLMNDPVMLVFEELKDWFLNTLGSREANSAVLEEIAKRQSYLKNIVHIIPHFGPDRLYVHMLQNKLEKATKILNRNMAHKELPHFLSETILSGQNFENLMGTYFHFLLIDEEVSDNYHVQYIQEPLAHFKQSPLSKIYHQANLVNAKSNKGLEKYKELSLFYQLSTPQAEHHLLNVGMNLRQALSASIRFATFVTVDDTRHYIEAVATLEAMSKVRHTLELLQSILPRLGSYVFAVRYIETIDALSQNYIKLTLQLKKQMKHLLQRADSGLNELFTHTDKSNTDKHFFEYNLRSLETKVARDTTVNNQLETFCKNLIDRIEWFQHSIKKLIQDMETGLAEKELSLGMLQIFNRIEDMNSFLPGVLGEKETFILAQSPALDKPKLMHITEPLQFFSHTQALINEPPITPVKAIDHTSSPSKSFYAEPSFLASVNGGIMLGAVVGNFLYKHSIFARCKKKPVVQAILEPEKIMCRVGGLA